MIKINLNKIPINYNEKTLLNEIKKILKIKKDKIKEIKIIKKSIDARKKPKIYYNLIVGICFFDEKIENNYNFEKIEIDISGLKYKKQTSNKKIYVVGFGPSGMFCSLALSKMGYCPTVIEQGSCVEERINQVQQFWEKGILNINSNVQFGEGGAGTFSDGKLTTNLNSQLCNKVINELYLHGAPKQILYESKPHIGSDKLCDVVKNMRNNVIKNGGKIFFDTKLTNIIIKNNSVKFIEITNVKTQLKTILACDVLCLCLGHSARDTFKLLKKLNLSIKQKPFAMGVRIEHKAVNINNMQYGENHSRLLPNADYKLVAHLKNQRSVFTFCMCPGGRVVASSSNQGEIVTNGMSNFKRDEKYSNSALLVNVMPSDFNSDDVLAGVAFQEKYERLAYKLGGENFFAPAETVSSFLYNKSNLGECSYKPGYKFTKLKNCLPKFVYESLKEGLEIFRKKYKYFALNTDVLIGVETRTSSPITILRNDKLVSNIDGIYPCGEGAGYAGGIVSSAQDGIKVAEAIYNNDNNI